MPSLHPDQGLQLIFLGGFDIRLNGRPVAGFSYNKMRALLAYLAVEREQDHKREVLAELLWGNCDATTARGNLRRTLSDLRHVLELPSGKTLFSVSKHTIRFIPDAYIDVLDFIGQKVTGQTPTLDEEEIIALYRGEFLAGLSVPDCPDFEGWLQIQRETLHHLALALLEHLSNRHAKMGDYGKALRFDLRYTELEPWDENAHRRAMRLYALNGQHSAALVQYEACCCLLKNELDALPNEETRQLAESIRNGEFRRRSPDTVEAPPPSIPQPHAERRQVTVLYCELTLAAIDDPDEAMVLLHAPQARCVAIIRQFSGHIVQTHGGGLLAYFGYPDAHEDAARRAVQAALAITQEAAYGIEIRAGVHTGLIITGGGSSMPDTSGMTSRLAIQLRHCAAHNEVVISQETLFLVDGYYDCASFGVQSLPGIARPVEIFKVIRESGARTRLDAAARLTPLVGRKIEIARLLELWEEAAQGSRQVVLVQGEAGIGKSRLLLTLKQRLGRAATRELRCFPEFSQSPFYPLIVMLEAILGFEHADTPEIKSDKLVKYLEAYHSASVPDAVPLLAQLLSLPLPGNYLAPGLSPQKHKEQTVAILLTLLQALAVEQPVLLIVEDLHWIDPSTLEMLTLFVEQTGRTPVLGVLTARPEFVPPWKDALTATLPLTPLVEDEVAEMIASLRADIPALTIRHIVARADGVPLFVEEVAKISSADDPTSIPANIPATLLDLLAARIDTMGEAKYTAQLAATIGREFDLSLLRMVCPYDPAALAHSLTALQDAGLILKVNETACQFKHALIQEAAYQSQIRTGRQAAHQRIAQTLLSDFPNAVTTRPELLAQHLASGGETRQSIEYWIKAGQRAALHSANTEAIEHFNSGLQLLMTLPPDKERDRMESKLQLNLGTTLIAIKGYGSVEAGLAYIRALELCGQVGDSAGLYQALWGMWLTSSSRVGHLHSLELAGKLLHLAEQGNDVLQLQSAHHAMGNSLLWTGQIEKARIHLKQSMALYQPSHHEAMVSQYGENICISSGSLLSTVLWLLGFPEQAGEVSQQTLALARQVNHPNSSGYTLSTAAILHRWLKQIETTGQLAQEAMTLSHKYGLPFWLGLGTASNGWVLAMQGQTAGVVHIQQCLDAANAIMSGTKVLFCAPLCEALIQLEQFDDALDRLNDALNVAEEKDDRFFESEFHRLKGMCLLEISDTNTKESEFCFDQALAISRKQGAKSLELRAAMSMARLQQWQGKQEDAQRLLNEIYGGFTEGFDTHDLREAEELLRALA